MRFNVTALQVLRESRDLLTRDGWRQDQFGPGEVKDCGPRCALGALYAVWNEHTPLDESVIDEVWGALDAALPATYDWGWNLNGNQGPQPRIAQWNDAAGRTENDAYELYSRAIAKLT